MRSKILVPAAQKVQRDRGLGEVAPERLGAIDDGRSGGTQLAAEDLGAAPHLQLRAGTAPEQDANHIGVDRILPEQLICVGVWALQACHPGKVSQEKRRSADAGRRMSKKKLSGSSMIRRAVDATLAQTRIETTATTFGSAPRDSRA